MRKIASSVSLLIALVCSALFAGFASTALWAHHNTQAEYGPFGSNFIRVQGTITDIKWGNPHVAFQITISGGDLPAEEIGQTWQVNSHPINVMLAYGFTKEEFAVGDRLDLLTWTHVRRIKHLWPRAIKVNDGPMKSNLRYTDMIDIANGTFTALNIEPAANLNGSDPIRAGTDTVEKLGQMGLLDAEGNMIWPPRQ